MHHGMGSMAHDCRQHSREDEAKDADKNKQARPPPHWHRYYLFFCGPPVFEPSLCKQRSVLHRNRKGRINNRLIDRSQKIKNKTSIAYTPWHHFSTFPSGSLSPCIHLPGFHDSLPPFCPSPRRAGTVRAVKNVPVGSKVRTRYITHTYISIIPLYQQPKPHCRA